VIGINFLLICLRLIRGGKYSRAWNDEDEGSRTSTAYNCTKCAVNNKISVACASYVGGLCMIRMLF
jgi:hypothetical protein